MMTIGEYLKKYRAEHGLSQRQFAALCGVSNGYISMLETGINTSTGQPIIPTLQTMRKISGAMGLTIHQVLSEVDDVVLDIGAEEEKQPPAAGELSDLAIQIAQLVDRLPSAEAFNIGHLGFIRVRGAIVHDETGALIAKRTTKNKTSRRTVPIMIPRLAELLSASVRERPPLSDQSERILACHPNSLYKAVNAICARAGLPLVGIHGLRHSFASLAHSLGVPEAECMVLGGWQDPQTMRRIYTHLDQAARLKASNAITAFYQNANEKR